MRQSKYNVGKDAEKRTCDGIVFDSAMEMKYYRDVVLPGLADGTIMKVERQKEYELQPKFRRDGMLVRAITYVADFYIEYSDGTSVVIDIKGFADSVATLKRKLFWAKYPEIDYRWLSLSIQDGGWVEWDDLQKYRRERKKQKLKEKESDNNGTEQCD